MWLKENNKIKSKTSNMHLVPKTNWDEYDFSFSFIQQLSNISG